jgi:DNA primase
MARQLQQSRPRARAFDLVELKAIPIRSLALDFGFKLTPAGTGRCILPGHDDKKPSFALRRAKNTFVCFACGRSGSTIDLVMQMHGVDFSDACRWLQERYTHSAPVYSTPSSIKVQEVPDARPTRHRIDPSIYAWLLKASPIRSSGREYLRKRGIPERTICRFQVGQMPAEDLLLRAQREWGQERLERSGLLAIGQYGPRMAFPKGYLLFPFFDGVEVVYLQARAPSSQANLRWVCPAGLRPPLYNSNVVLGKAKTVWLCEGITDVLSADAMKHPAIGLLGAHADLPVDKARALARKDVVIVADADPAGNSFRARMTKLLRERGATVVAKALPAGCKDLNDYLVQRNTRK